MGSSARGGRGTSHTGEEPGEGASRNEQHSHLSHSHLGGSRQLEKADRAATTSDSVLRLRCQNWCWGAWGSAQEGVDMLERGWREPTFEDEQMQKRSPPASSPPPPRLALQKRSVSQVFSGGSPLAKRCHSSTGRASKPPRGRTAVCPI